MNAANPPFILASASPRRRELLERAGFSPKIFVAEITEDENPLGDPEKMVRHNARIKARAVSLKFPDALVLGADTTVALDEIVLNKPANLDEARAMLKRLSGRAHTVFTGVTFCCATRDFSTGTVPFEEEFCVKSRVVFKPLNDEIISRYFEIVNPLDKAGAYGIQAGRELIIAHYDAPVSNIMGLPVERVAERLAALGIRRN